MGGLFKPSVPSVTPAATPVATDDAAVEEARRKELIAAQKARGRAASVVTGGSGDTSLAPVATKRLVGE